MDIFHCFKLCARSCELAIISELPGAKNSWELFSVVGAARQQQHAGNAGQSQHRD